MNLSKDLGFAIDRGDGGTVSKIVDFLRFRCGWTYGEVLSFAQAARPGLERATWDDLLRQADEEVERLRREFGGLL